MSRPEGRHGVALALSGVSSIERTHRGVRWRWLSPSASSAFSRLRQPSLVDERDGGRGVGSPLSPSDLEPAAEAERAVMTRGKRCRGEAGKLRVVRESRAFLLVGVVEIRALVGSWNSSFRVEGLSARLGLATAGDQKPTVGATNSRGDRS